MFTTPPTRADVLAALDIGTNNCRLLVARCAETSDGLRPEIIDAFSRLVRLGEGLSQSPKMKEEAMQRTLEALEICYAKMLRRGVTRYRVVATESCRRATNAPIFIEQVKKRTGLIVEVISATEEARLALQGCLPLFDQTRKCAIHFDIGGGSTELAFATINPGNRDEPVTIKAQTSLAFGVTGMTEIYGGDTVSDAIYQRMLDDLMQAMKPFAESIADDLRAYTGGDGNALQLLGCAGTVTTVAALAQNLPSYRRELVDGYDLTCDDALTIFQKLRGMSYLERSTIGTMGTDRADLIIAGCAIVEAIIRMWPPSNIAGSMGGGMGIGTGPSLIRVADRGVREGILYDLLGRKRLG